MGGRVPAGACTTCLQCGQRTLRPSRFVLTAIKFRNAEALLRARKKKEAIALAREARASTDNPAFQQPIDAWLAKHAR